MLVAGEGISPPILSASRSGGAEQNGKSRSPQAQRDPAQCPEGCGHGSTPPTRGRRARRGHDLRARGSRLRKRPCRGRSLGHAQGLGRRVGHRVPLRRWLRDLLSPLAPQARRASRQRLRGPRARSALPPRARKPLPFRGRGCRGRLSVAAKRGIPPGAGRHRGRLERWRPHGSHDAQAARGR
jgi:hypothetical protein